jgi:hypothetical protein
MAIATQVLYKTEDGKSFNSEAEALAHEAMLANKAEIEAFVAKHFPAKEGSQRNNPHASTAARAIALWLGAKAA